MIIFLFGVFLLIISAFLWPWGSTAKAIKTHVDAQVTDEEQERIWELSRSPGSMDTADTLAEMESLLLEEMRRLDDPYRLWNQPDDGLVEPQLRVPSPRKNKRK